MRRQSRRRPAGPWRRGTPEGDVPQRLAEDGADRAGRRLHAAHLLRLPRDEDVIPDRRGVRRLDADQAEGAERCLPGQDEADVCDARGEDPHRREGVRPPTGAGAGHSAVGRHRGQARLQTVHSVRLAATAAPDRVIKHEQMCFFRAVPLFTIANNTL